MPTMGLIKLPGVAVRTYAPSPPPIIPAGASFQKRCLSRFPNRQCDNPRSAGREYLGGVHTGARCRRRYSEAQKDRRGDKPVGHSDRPIDDLGREADGREQEEVRHVGPQEQVQGGRRATKVFDPS